MQLDQRGASQTLLVVIIGLLAAVLAGAGGYLVRDNSANQEIEELKTEVQRLEKKTSDKEEGIAVSSSEAPAANEQASQSTTFSNANVGFSVEVPAEWASQWRYQEQSNIGDTTNNVNFFLINKEDKYAPVVTIAKVAQAKYDSARAGGSALGNADNVLHQGNGFVYVMVFQDNSVGDFKNFTYAQATKAARERFKATFKLL